MRSVVARAAQRPLWRLSFVVARVTPVALQQGAAMEHGAHPYRSVLYMPGSNQRALDKARALAADALILDLEDAVAPAEKPRARELVAEAVEAGGYGRRRLLVRINGLDTEWGGEDLARAARAAPDAILVPKVETPADIARVAALLEAAGARETTRVWAMMETPRGVLNAAAVAASHRRLEGFVLGTNDLAKDLQAAHTPDRLPLAASLGLCLLAARAGGLVCVDGVFNAFRDDDGLRAECRQGRAMGFDGKSLVHPAQIAIANEVFAPTPGDVALARQQVAAFEEAGARGQGVAVVDGRIVENLHVATARRLLARAEAIAALEAAAG
jgi:citrate lyase beta subunit